MLYFFYTLSVSLSVLSRAYPVFVNVYIFMYHSCTLPWLTSLPFLFCAFLIFFLFSREHSSYLFFSLSHCLCVWICVYCFFFLIALICDYLRHLNGFAFMTIIITAENNSYIQKSRNVYFIQILVQRTTRCQTVCSSNVFVFLFLFVYMCDCVCAGFFLSLLRYSTKMTLNNSVLAL